MDVLLTFGDVFSIGEKEYVYLGLQQDLIYAALICSKRDTDKVVDMHNKVAASGVGAPKLNENRLYCFVILTTDEFEGRAAHLGNPSLQSVPRMQKACSLNEQDIVELKKEIQASRGVPNALRDIVAKL